MTPLRVAVVQESRISPHQRQGQLLEKSLDCGALLITSLAGQRTPHFHNFSHCTLVPGQSDLRGHMKRHSRIKSNKCNQCEYASSQAVNLRRHLKTHSGEKSNKCNQCEYASTDAGSLRSHLKTHIWEKSNKCNQCEYASYQADHLREHLKTHIGEK